MSKIAHIDKERNHKVWIGKAVVLWAEWTSAMLPDTFPHSLVFSMPQNLRSHLVAGEAMGFVTNDRLGTFTIAHPQS